VSIGYLIGQAPLLVKATIRATSSHPDWLVIVSGFVLLNAWMLFGFLLGAVVRAPYSFAICVIVSLTINYLLPAIIESVFARTTISYPAYAVVPWWPQTAFIGRHEIISVACYRIIWAAAFGLAFWRITSFLDRPLAGRGVRQRIGRSLTALIVPVVLIAAGAILHPVAIADDNPMPISCAATTRGVRVCVPSDVATLLPMAIQTTQQILDTVGTAQMTQPIGPKGLITAAPGQVPAIYQQLIVQAVADDLAGVGANTASCLETPTGPTPAGQAAEAIATTIANRIWYPDQFGSQANDDTPDGRLAGTSNAALTAWLDAHGDALRACQILPDALP
jgi:hypothetical protein